MWMELSEQAADQQDPKKLALLILQINSILEAKELRLKDKVTIPQPPVENRFGRHRDRALALVLVCEIIGLEKSQRVCRPASR
jgi:hypothetical protein